MTTPEALPLTAEELSDIAEDARAGEFSGVPMRTAHRLLSTIAAEKARADKAEAELEQRKQGPKFLALFDLNNATGPFSDKEVKDIRECAWPFLLDDGNKGTLAHMVFRLADDVIKQRATMADNATLSAKLAVCVEAMQAAFNHIDKAMGDTDPTDESDPLLLASQALAPFCGDDADLPQSAADMTERAR